MTIRYVIRPPGIGRTPRRLAEALNAETRISTAINTTFDWGSDLFLAYPHPRRVQFGSADNPHAGDDGNTRSSRNGGFRSSGYPDVYTFACATKAHQRKLLGEAHPAVNKAAGPGEPVTQQIAVSVKGDKVECAINGQVVGSYPKADIVAPGKLKSTDGVYGIRFAHNTEAMVVGLTMTKP